VHNDHLGTPQVMTDEAGGVVWRGVYDPFGRASIDGGSSVEMNVRFPGQYHDVETGLHYNYKRYYDPGTGRYLTYDPIGLAGGINPYLYANVNPLRFIDPTGEIIPFIAACALNPVCASAVRAGVGGIIGGLSALVAATSDPCFDGSIGEVITSGAIIGAGASLVPGGGALLGAAARGGAAGLGGNVAGQIATKRNIREFDVTQAITAGIVGSTAYVGGNFAGLNAALGSVRTGAGLATALAEGESVGSATSALIGTTGALAEIAAQQSKSTRCGCK
jgi:RHS repeat-associated protein